MLKHIRETQCLECGAGINRTFRAERPHTNGTTAESVSFHCGYTIEYSPNHGRSTNTGKCTRSETYRKEHETLLSEAKLLDDFIVNNITSPALLNIRRDIGRFLR